MCLSVQATSYQSDPTRTLTLRRLFVNQMLARYNGIRRIVNTSISKNDCFATRGGEELSDYQSATWATKVENAIVPTQPPNTWKDGLTPIPRWSFLFRDDAKKIEGFMGWMDKWNSAALFQKIVYPEITDADIPVWMNTYINTAYKRGMLWGREALRREPGVLKTLGLERDDVRTDDTTINSDFNSIINLNRVRTLYTRAYTDLEGITAAVDAEISRILTDGLMKGDAPKTIAKEIVSRISKVGAHRATLLARTETIRAHHLGAVQTYRQFGVAGVKVLVEWDTAGDARVCELCSPLDGKTFTLDDIEFMIPVHPQCRCGVVPIVEDEDGN